MTHLSNEELAAEVKAIADPFNLPDDDDARVPTHLRECEVCRDRLGVLFAQYTEAANALTLKAYEPTGEGHLDDDALNTLFEVEAGIASPKKEDALLLGHLERCSVCRERLSALQADERALALALSTAGETFLREATSRHLARHGAADRLGATTGDAGRSLFSRRTVGLLGVAAGLGLAALVPSFRSAITTSGERPVSLVSTKRETIRDTAPGFAEKGYVQQVSAGSGVNLVVEGTNGSEFDCELYDRKQATAVQVDQRIGNSCSFFVVAPEAGEYRLVVKNRLSSPMSYMMVTSVVRDSSRGTVRPDEPVAP